MTTKHSWLHMNQSAYFQYCKQKECCKTNLWYNTANAEWVSLRHNGTQRRNCILVYCYKQLLHRLVRNMSYVDLKWYLLYRRICSIHGIHSLQPTPDRCRPNRNLTLGEREAVVMGKAGAAGATVEKVEKAGATVEKVAMATPAAAKAVMEAMQPNRIPIENVARFAYSVTRYERLNLLCKMYFLHWNKTYSQKRWPCRYILHWR